MCYDDMIRVADLKTRSTRAARAPPRSALKQGTEVLQVTEYFHPRIEEILRHAAGWARPATSRRGRSSPPSSTAASITAGASAPTVSLALPPLVDRRHAPLAPRHAAPQGRDRASRALARAGSAHAPKDYALAVEILNCRRLIKGYSDTHARAQSKFDRVLSALPLLKGRERRRRLDAPPARGRAKDEDGKALDGALKTVATL